MLSPVVTVVVSAFRGKGTAWQTWNVFEDVSSTFAKVSQSPLTLYDTDLPILEKFVVTMYNFSLQCPISASALERLDT